VIRRGRPGEPVAGTEGDGTLSGRFRALCAL
jgi:hypothetical protein